MNNLRGYTTIDVANEQKIVKYDINALCALEQKLGNKSLQEIFNEKSLNFTWIRCVLWAGLIHGDKKFTVADAGRLLDEHFETGGDLGELVQELMTAMTTVFPQEKRTGKPSTKKRQTRKTKK